MKYIDSGKNNNQTVVNFKNVPNIGVRLASGPIIRDGIYIVEGDELIKPLRVKDLYTLNCIDIDWNLCLVDNETTLETTGDLIRWIKKIVKEAGNFDYKNFKQDNNNNLYYNTGTNSNPDYKVIFSVEDPVEDGSITTDKLADEAVTTPKIANEAVTKEKLAPGLLQYTNKITESSNRINIGTLKFGNDSNIEVYSPKGEGAGIANVEYEEKENTYTTEYGTLIFDKDTENEKEVTILGPAPGTANIEITPNEDITDETPGVYEIATITINEEEPIVLKGKGSGVYEAGDGIEISEDNKISVTEASDLKIGGIKLGYIENGKNYPVQTFEGKAYVNVPWITGDDLAVGKMYMQAFKTTNTKTPIPNLPGDQFPNEDDGWKQYAENNDATQFVWMATRLIDSTGSWIDDSWNGPWLITGPQGEAGADGKDIEFIYRRNNDPSTAPEGSSSLTGKISGQGNTITLTLEQYKITDDFVPSGWNDNPEGITSDMRCEWMCIRTKTNNEWSSFIGPVLWSRWGQNGVDGDGVEYIYYASSNGTISVGLYPNEWSDTSTEVGKNGKKFLDREYLGPNNSLWVDNPIDLDKSGYGQGSKEWVSIRKWNRQTEKWGKFSEPALWTYYPKNGVSEGYTVDLTNETMPIGTTTGGVVKNYSNTCGVQVFHNGELITSGYTITIGTITGSKNNIGISNVSASLANNIITVTINSTGLTGFAGEYFTIPITVRLSNGTEYKKSITGYGLSVGEPGTSMELVTGASVIRVNYDLTICAPSILSPLAKVIKKDSNGNDTVVMYNPLSANPSSSNPFDFYYLYLGSSNSTSTRLTTNSITIGDNYKTYDGILINLKYNNNIIDNEYIPFVRDGAPGIGISPITYRILPISSDMTCYYDSSDNLKVSGSISFKVFKDVYERNNLGVTTLISEEMTSKGTSNTWTSSDNEVLEVKVLGLTLSFSRINDTWKVSISTPISYNNVPYASITLTSVTNTVLTSLVIPFIMQGKDGKSVSGLQSLDGVVMRFSVYNSNSIYSDGLYPSSDGIKYLDIVEYGGSYYRPKNSVNGNNFNFGSELGYPMGDNGVGSNWEIFAPSGATAFLYMIANNAYIQNLTAKNIVITQGTGNDTTVVAGMVSGAYLTKDSNTDEFTVTNTSTGSTYTSNGVRIFAGPPTDANLTTCPFYVDNTGAGQLAGGKISWSKSNGNWNLNINDGGINCNNGTTYYYIDLYNGICASDYDRSTLGANAQSGEWASLDYNGLLIWNDNDREFVYFSYDYIWFDNLYIQRDANNSMNSTIKIKDYDSRWNSEYNGVYIDKEKIAFKSPSNQVNRCILFYLEDNSSPLTISGELDNNNNNWLLLESCAGITNDVTKLYLKTLKAGLIINGELECGNPDYSLIIDSDDSSVTFEHNVNSDPMFEFNGDVEVVGSVTATGSVTWSDNTLKDITSNVNITLELIANAPAVNFTWKTDSEKEDKKEHSGTIAQYWKEILPQVVSTNRKTDKLGLEYGNAAMVSSIITAREVVILKLENQTLKERLSALEEKINLLIQ